jgi:hypothetical protein
MQLFTYPTSVSITEVTLTKTTKSDKVGLTLRNKPGEAGIAITGLSETSPLRGSAIRANGGQVLIAINGNPDLPDAMVASEMICNTMQVSFLVCEQQQDNNITKRSFIQVVAAPFWKHNPGINFSSTRGRTLVTVSKIFKSGPFMGNPFVRQGDIVLAVNGIPVSKPEEADRALRMPQANGLATVLHTIDMNYFRVAVIKAVDTKQIAEANISFKQGKTKEEPTMLVKRWGHDERLIRIQYDPETQHMHDPEPYTKLENENDIKTWNLQKTGKGKHMLSVSPVLQYPFCLLQVTICLVGRLVHATLRSDHPAFFKRWYFHSAYKFITMYNQIVDANLDPLEDLACEHAWRNSPSKVVTSPLFSSCRGVTSEEEVVTPSTLKTRSRSKSLDEPHYISC